MLVSRIRERGQSEKGSMNADHSRQTLAVIGKNVQDRFQDSPFSSTPLQQLRNSCERLHEQDVVGQGVFGAMRTMP